MNAINIKTTNGSMTVDVDNFFPCSRARLTKMFRILRQSAGLNDVPGIAVLLRIELKSRIQRLDDSRLAYAKKYFAEMRERAGYQDMLESGKRPNGIRLTAEEMADFRKKSTAAANRAKSYLRESGIREREIKALKRNLEALDCMKIN